MPNFYLFMAPGWLAHNGSVMEPLVHVGNYIVDCIHKMQRESIKSLTPRADSTAAFNIHVQKWLKNTDWTDEYPSSSKNKGAGYPNALWPGIALHFTKAIDKPRFEDYHIEYKHDDPFAYLGSGFTWAEKPASLDQTPFLTGSQLDSKRTTAMQQSPEVEKVLELTKSIYSLHYSLCL